MNKNTKRNKIARGHVYGERKSKSPKVARSAAEISRRISGK